MQGRAGKESTDEVIDWEALPDTISYIEQTVPQSQRSHTSATPEEIIIDDIQDETREYSATAQESFTSDNKNNNETHYDTESEQNSKSNKSEQYSRPSSATTDNNKENRRNSFKSDINEIKDHKKRRGQLKFLVVWKGFTKNEAMWEHEALIVEQNPRALKGYLKELKKSHWKKFLALVRAHQHLGLVLNN